MSPFSKYTYSAVFAMINLDLITVILVFIFRKYRNLCVFITCKTGKIGLEREKKIKLHGGNWIWGKKRKKRHLFQETGLSTETLVFSSDFTFLTLH